MLLVDNGAGSSKVLADEITRIGAKFRVLKNDSVGEIDQYSGIVISGRAVQSRESKKHTRGEFPSSAYAMAQKSLR